MIADKDKDGEARLEAEGKAALDNNEVVDVELIDVDVVDGVIVPQRLREQIRAAGPTNRTDLGKQARPEVAARQSERNGRTRPERRRCTATTSSTTIS